MRFLLLAVATLRLPAPTRCGLALPNQLRQRPAQTPPAQSVSVAHPVDHPHLSAVAVFGSLPGVFCYALSIKHACAAPFLSAAWSAHLLLVLLSSVALAASLAPTVLTSLDRRHGARFFAALLGAHLFASTAPALLIATLAPSLPSAASRAMLLASAALNIIGGVFEIVGHFRDGWWFYDGCEAESGVPNRVFSVCLIGAFSFLAAAPRPSLLACAAAAALPAAVWVEQMRRTCQQSYQRMKPLVYGLSGVSSLAACVVYGLLFRSYWPVLYYAQSFTIVRNGKRILNSGEQILHLLPSVYGWFSYVVPFGLAAHPATSGAPLAVVALAAAASVAATHALEDAMVHWAARRREDNTAPAADPASPAGKSRAGRAGRATA